MYITTIIIPEIPIFLLAIILSSCYTIPINNPGQKNNDYIERITSDFSKIHNYLNDLLDNKLISDRLYHGLREFINRVAEQIARKHDDVKKGVTNIMGGKIIMTTAKRYYNGGVADGFNLGGKKCLIL